MKLFQKCPNEKERNRDCVRRSREKKKLKREQFLENLKKAEMVNALLRSQFINLEREQKTALNKIFAMLANMYGKNRNYLRSYIKSCLRDCDAESAFGRHLAEMLAQLARGDKPDSSHDIVAINNDRNSHFNEHMSTTTETQNPVLAEAPLPCASPLYNIPTLVCEPQHPKVEVTTKKPAQLVQPIGAENNVSSKILQTEHYANDFCFNSDDLLLNSPSDKRSFDWLNSPNVLLILEHASETNSEKAKSAEEIEQDLKNCVNYKQEDLSQPRALTNESWLLTSLTLPSECQETTYANNYYNEAVGNQSSAHVDTSCGFVYSEMPKTPANFVNLHNARDWNQFGGESHDDHRDPFNFSKSIELMWNSQSFS